MSSPQQERDEYYSPQAMRTEMFKLDLQVANLKAIVELQARHAHQVDAMLADLQAQIRSCMARHDGENK